jgi:hypothetical protein
MRCKGNTRRAFGTATILLGWIFVVLALRRMPDENPGAAIALAVAFAPVTTWGWLRGPQAGHPWVLRLLLITLGNTLGLYATTRFHGELNTLAMAVTITAILALLWEFATGILRVAPTWEADRRAGIKRNFFDHDDGLPPVQDREPT